jgi:bifunctional DNA-binding transcriptional regulator/antitoxin component of YhaV-PrlF toxin-antitoxin module
MTLKTIIKVTADGKLELPPEIRSRLQSGDEFLLWEEKDTIILKKVQNSLVDDSKQQERIKGDERFFEIADRLAELNKVDPITEEEIQEEIRAYRREKRGLA